MIPLYIVDAFAAQPFTGNPAGVVLLDGYPEDAVLARIAAENNLAETAFLVPAGEDWQLRWFTPTVEVPLCGHATLASSWVIFTHIAPERDQLTFHTRQSGALHVRRDGERLTLDFPSTPPTAEVDIDLEQILGVKPLLVLDGQRRYLALLESAAQVRALRPDIAGIGALRHGSLVITAPGDEGYDIVSRYFAPGAGIPEDPVTGGAHCMLTPWWCDRLGKRELRAYQASQRGGEIICRLLGDRVEMEGACIPYAQGQIVVPL